MENNTAPCILEETEDYAVVFKPPRMHSVQLVKKSGGALEDRYSADNRPAGGSLLEWYKDNSDSLYDIMHRLDYETQGLVLFAKNKTSYDFFKSAQDSGEFVKEYSAVCEQGSFGGEGFPPPPAIDAFAPSPEKPLVVMSYFRPFGPGRKSVRPVIDGAGKYFEIAKDKGGFYRTEIVGMDGNVFTVRIKRGFRHQIRCHLSWIGFPILNDNLYNDKREERAESREQRADSRGERLGSVGQRGLLEANTLALRACALFFKDPASGEQREYRIAPLD